VYKTFGGQLWQKNVFVVRQVSTSVSVIDLLTPPLDWVAYPRSPLLYGLHPEPLRLGPSFQHRHPIRHPRRPRRSLAPDSNAPRLPRWLVRLRCRRPMDTPHQSERDPPPDSYPVLVREECAGAPRRGPRPVRRHLHGADVCFQEPVARQERVLLRLWVLRCC
jgi:hypothetical protein